MNFVRITILTSILLITVNINGFCQGDSLSPVKSWLLCEDGQHEEIEMDTTLNGSFQSYPWYYNQSFAWHGNTWSPVFPLFYIQRERNEGEIHDWLAHYQSFSNNTYYNTKRPYTLIDFNNNAKKQMPEQNLEFIHTQNINPWWNAGVSGNFATSKGKYQHQENRMNNFRIFSSYNGLKHTGYISYNFGKVGIQENGGIADIALYRDSVLSPEIIPVNLTSALNTIKYRSLYVKQEHVLARASYDSLRQCIPWTVSAGAGFEFNRHRRLYTDVPTSFYSSVYVDTTSTNDSLQISNYISSAYLKMDFCRKVSLYAGAFFERNDYGIYENHIRDDETGVMAGGNYNSTRFNAAVNIHSHFSSSEVPHIHIRSMFSYKISEKYLNVIIEPSYIESHPLSQDCFYYSNNFSWNNEFMHIKTTGIKAGVEIPEYKARIILSNKNVTNAVYYDSTARPVQMADAVTYSSATLNFVLGAGNWKWSPNIIYQSLSSDLIPDIPALITVQHISYSNRIFKVLDFQIGTEVFYTSEFYGPSYMPATMIYYRQNDQKTGNYPIADVYISFKLKRARFLFKVHHLNDRFIPRNNFLVAGYPLPDRHFTLGISWSFYN